MKYATTKKYLVLPLAALILLSSLTGCANLSKTEKGAAVGAGAGAVIGGVIGKKAGGTAKGAIIGAVVGGTAGAIIGQQMDKQARELDRDLEGADVKRVGEGIEVTFDSAILFGFDQSNLTETARANLRDLAQSLQKYPNTEIVIVGHTDSKGSDSYNQSLSERRASSAASFLASQGISRSRMTTVGRGESEPVSSADSENRRVEVAIYASEEYREQLSQR